LTIAPSIKNGKIPKIKPRKLFIFTFFSGRPSLLLRDDDHHSTNGGDAIIDMGSDGTFHSSMKQQLQVIDESV